MFADGTYLELFCWIDTPREFYAWANKLPGLIDFALTSMPPSTAQSLHNGVMSRLKDDQNYEGLDVSYTLPEAGGRVKPDDVHVKWESSRPVSSKSAHRTDFPFFCHDITPRNVRVPFEDDRKTKHPCDAVSISNVQMLVPESEVSKFAELYGRILGTPPKIVDESGNCKKLDFEIGLPNRGYGQSSISLYSGESEVDQDWLRTCGTGICCLTLSLAGRQGHGEEALGTEGTASRIHLKW